MGLYKIQWRCKFDHRWDYLVDEFDSWDEAEAAAQEQAQQSLEMYRMPDFDNQGEIKNYIADNTFTIVERIMNGELKSKNKQT